MIKRQEFNENLSNYFQQNSVCPGMLMKKWNLIISIYKEVIVLSKTGEIPCRYTFLATRAITSWYAIHAIRAKFESCTTCESISCGSELCSLGRALRVAKQYTAAYRVHN